MDDKTRYFLLLFKLIMNYVKLLVMLAVNGDNYEIVRSERSFNSIVFLALIRVKEVEAN